MNGLRNFRPFTAGVQVLFPDCRKRLRSLLLHFSRRALPGDQTARKNVGEVKGDFARTRSDRVEAGNGLVVDETKSAEAFVGFKTAFGRVLDRERCVSGVVGRLQSTENLVRTTVFGVASCGGIAIDPLDGFLETLGIDAGGLGQLFGSVPFEDRALLDDVGELEALGIRAGERFFAEVTDGRRDLRPIGLVKFMPKAVVQSIFVLPSSPTASLSMRSVFLLHRVRGGFLCSSTRRE